MLPIRRCLAFGLLVALAAALSFSAVQAQPPGDPAKGKVVAPKGQDIKGMDPKALDPTGKSVKPADPKGMDPVLQEKKEAAKQPEKGMVDPGKYVPPAEKTYSFIAASQPWSQVIDWLVTVLDLPFIGDVRPTGSLKFTPPPGADGKPKKYTVPEILDILNEALLQHKMLIIRRTASFTVWPADEPLPLELVKSVQVEDLNEKLAKTEYVRVNYQLKAFQADIFAPSVKKMMGPFGQVIPLEEANQLILIENVGNLREIVKIVQKIEADEDQRVGTLSWPCKYCRAAVAAEKLKDILGDTSSTGGVNPKGGGAAAALPGAGGAQLAAKGGNRTLKAHTISYDDTTNVVFVNGPPEKINIAKQVLKTIDVPGIERMVGPPELKIYLVPAGNADITAKMLQDIYKQSTTLRISAVGTTQIMVYAPVADQFDIVKYITGAVPPKDVTFVYVLANSEANKIADLVLDRLANAPGAPLVKSDMSRNAIVIIGSPEQVDLVKVMISSLTGEPIPVSGSISVGMGAGANTRTIVLDKGGAATLANALERAWKEISPVPLTVYDPLSGLGIQPEKKGDDKNPAGKKDELKKDKSDIKAPGKQPQASAPIERNSNRYAMASTDEDGQQPQKKDDKGDKSITIETLGNKLVIKSNDPEALAKMSDLIRVLTTNTNSPADFVVIPLKTASAAQTASILDHVFNGAAQGGGGGGKGGGAAAGGGKGGKGGKGGGGGGGIADLIGGFFGGIGGDPGAIGGIGGAGGKGRVERIRVVADTGTNKLLVWASPLDLLIIRDLLGKAIDVEPESEAIPKTWNIGPLKHAVATEVANMIGNVYAAKTGKGAAPANMGGGMQGMQFGGGQAAPGGGAQAGGQAVTLAIGVDERTNSIMVHCNKALFTQIKELVDTMETAAEKATPTIVVREFKNADPNLVQHTLDAIQGRSNIGGNQKGGGAGGAFGGQGGGGQGGAFGGGGAGAGGAMPGAGGAGGGGKGAGGAGGGGKGAGGAGGGGKGGGGKGGLTYRSDANNSPDLFTNLPGASIKGVHTGLMQAAALQRQEPAFFDEGVMEDPAFSTIYDPIYDGQLDLSEIMASPAHMGFEPQTVPASAPQVQPAAFFGGQPPGGIQPPDFKTQQPKGQPGEISKGPRLPVQAIALPELGVVILKANNPEDMKEALMLLDLLQKYADKTEIKVEVVKLEYGDANSVSNTLLNMYRVVQYYPNSTILTPRSGGAGAGAAAGGGGTAGAVGVGGQQSATVYIQPLPRFNSILVGAIAGRMPDIIKDIKKFDRETVDEGGQIKFETFALKNQSAFRVASLIQNFWNERFAPTDPLQSTMVRVAYDDQTNSVFVQAAPADMSQIKSLINTLENRAGNEARNELRVVPIKTALSDDLAALIQRALNQSVYQSSNTFSGVVPGAPGVAAGGGAPVNQATGATTGQTTAVTPGQVQQILPGISTKYTGVKFINSKGDSFDASILEDVHVYSDTRTNSLVINAPAETMNMLLALVKQMDVPPQFTASINVFTLKKADALTVSNILSQMLLGTTTGAAGAAAKGGAAGGQAGKAVSGIGAAGQAPEGAQVIDVRITIDDRSNSIIAAGSPNDLAVINAIISKLDDINVPMRLTRVFQLYNAQAADVATILTSYNTASKAVYTAAGQLTAYYELQKDIILVAEPISNKLIVNVSVNSFEELSQLISYIDVQPLQVRIETMIAEVDVTNTEEFGMEFGIQGPILFDRSITSSAPPTTPGPAPTTTAGFNFNNTGPLGNNTSDGRGTVGLQGLNNLGVGRFSPTAGVGGFVFSAASDTFNLLIRALETQQRLQILSAPRITTADNQAARILVGQSFPYVNGSVVTTTTTGIPTVTNTVLYRDIGTQLQVTPKISPDGTVVMRVVPEISSATQSNVNIGNGVFATAFNVQTVETTVICQDGETVALGGLIQWKDLKTENKMPWFGDLPWVGAAFRFRTQQKSKTELLVILTPHVERCRADRTLDLQEGAHRMYGINWGQAQKVYGGGDLNTVLPPTLQGLPGGCGVSPQGQVFVPGMAPYVPGTMIEQAPAPRPVGPGQPGGQPQAYQPQQAYQGMLPQGMPAAQSGPAMPTQYGQMNY